MKMKKNNPNFDCHNALYVYRFHQQKYNFPNKSLKDVAEAYKTDKNYLFIRYKKCIYI